MYDGNENKPKDILKIADRTSDPRIKLEAKKAANETLRYIMELITGGVICSKAFEAVTQTHEKIALCGSQTIE